MCRMPLTGSRVGTRNRLIQCTEKLRVEFVTLVESTTFLSHESRPRFQSDAAEFIRRHPVQLRFNFGITHDTERQVEGAEEKAERLKG